MRLWSLHPSYLDAKGLVALWREGLLAQKVIRGQTNGYLHHPQLTRFRSTKTPVAAIATYLSEVSNEAIQRNYNFDAAKIARGRVRKKMFVTSGQLEFELDHLLRKLWKRDRSRYRELKWVSTPQAHPIFIITAGHVAEWERV